jgi:hypothetical protein
MLALSLLALHKIAPYKKENTNQQQVSKQKRVADDQYFTF